MKSSAMALTARRAFLGFLPVEGEAQRVDFAHDGSIVVGTTDRGLQIFDPAASHGRRQIIDSDRRVRHIERKILVGQLVVQ